MSSLKQATNECIPSPINSTKKFIPVPGWNDYVKEQHHIARHAFKWWNLNNRPLNGFIYHEMRTIVEPDLNMLFVSQEIFRIPPKQIL